MTTRLRWRDTNLAEQGHRVYADAAPLNPDNLPAPVADLGADIVSYDHPVETDTYFRPSAYVGAVEKVGGEAFGGPSAPGEVIGPPVAFHYLMDTLVGGEVVGASGGPNAIIRGNPVQVALSSGYAMSFDGSGDYLAIREHVMDGAYPALSAGCWFRTTDRKGGSLISYDRSEFYRLHIGPRDISEVGEGTGMLSVGFTCDDGLIYDMMGRRFVCDGEWHLALFTYDTGVATLYLDTHVEYRMTVGNTIGPSPLDVPRYGFIATGSEAEVEDGATLDRIDYSGEVARPFQIYRAIPHDEVIHMYLQGPTS